MPVISQRKDGKYSKIYCSFCKKEIEPELRLENNELDFDFGNNADEKEGWIITCIECLEKKKKEFKEKEERRKKAVK